MDFFPDQIVAFIGLLTEYSVVEKWLQNLLKMESEGTLEVNCIDLSI